MAVPIVTTSVQRVNLTSTVFGDKMWVKMSEIVSSTGVINDRLSITVENVELVGLYGQK